MSDSKELLEATVKGLQEKVDSLTKDLAAKKNELEDINKPKISQSVYEEIEDSVYNNMESALDRLSESDYDLELELSGLELSVYQLNFHDTNSISEYIMDAINDKFNVVEDETTTDNS
tara:strand:+ start:1596 stop:1949 length:354 start_codon:yes stop_codon:yes gene_type:complete